MKVHLAVMLDEERVAEHNCPNVILAASEQLLLSRVRVWLKIFWLKELQLKSSEVDKLTIDELNEKLCQVAPGFFIHTSSEDV
jgi:hypothetical protein